MLHEIHNDTVLECCVCMHSSCVSTLCWLKCVQQISVTLASMGDQCDLQVTFAVAKLVAVAVAVIANVEVDALTTVARVAGLGSSRPFLYMST